MKGDDVQWILRDIFQVLMNRVTPLGCSHFNPSFGFLCLSTVRISIQQRCWCLPGVKTTHLFSPNGPEKDFENSLDIRHLSRIIWNIWRILFTQSKHLGRSRPNQLNSMQCFEWLIPKWTNQRLLSIFHHVIRYSLWIFKMVALEQKSDKGTIF